MIEQINHLKFRTRNWVEINDESRGTYNANSDIKLKTSAASLNLVMNTYMLKQLYQFQTQ